MLQLAQFPFTSVNREAQLLQILVPLQFKQLETLHWRQVPTPEREYPKLHPVHTLEFKQLFGMQLTSAHW